MIGNKLLIDTNIVLYLLSGNLELAEKINNKEIYISFITELELLGLKEISKKEQKVILDFLDNCTIIDINLNIKNLTLKIKQNYTIKLPDAIVAATANYLKIPLLTADKGFNKIKELRLILHEL